MTRGTGALCAGDAQGCVQRSPSSPVAQRKYSTVLPVVKPRFFPLVPHMSDVVGWPGTEEAPAAMQLAPGPADSIPDQRAEVDMGTVVHDGRDVNARLETAERLLRRGLAGECSLVDAAFVAVEYIAQARAIQGQR